MQIFVTGVHNDIGRLAPIDSRREARLRQSVYSDDSILAVFRTFDLSFIVQVVLSLFAILFTYDAVNGERQAGTLKLIFSNAVPRARFILAKIVGIWLGLAVPLLLPALLGLLVVVLLGVPLTADHWGRLAVFGLASALYFTFFIALGLGVSALTRRPASSFLVLLVAWVLLVLVVPRLGLMAAVQKVQVPSVAEMESRKAGFEQRAWEEHERAIRGTWSERQAQLAGLSEAEQQALEDERMWQWLEEDDTARKAVEVEIAAHAERLGEEMRNLKLAQERLALELSRASPASAYRLAAMSLAGTGVELKARYEEAARGYRARFTEWVASQGGGDNVMVHRRRGGGAGNERGVQAPVDLTEMPRFEAPRWGFRQAIAPTPPDLGLLALGSLLCFAGGFVGFLRYDVR